MLLENWGSIPTNKGVVLNIFQIIKAVMLSAAEAELGAFFINVKMAVSMQQTLKEPGHLQPRTPIQTDNSKAHALLSNKIMPKALKAMDMCCIWLKGQEEKEKFQHHYWRPGTQNLADYFKTPHCSTANSTHTNQ